MSIESVSSYLAIGMGKLDSNCKPNDHRVTKTND